MDELLNELERNEGIVCAYADDLLLVIEGDSKADVGMNGTRLLGIVQNWGETVEVPVSIDKTSQILLKGFLDVNTPPRILLYDRCVKYESNVKYLGVWMSERMNFRIHVNKLKDKMVNVVHSMQRVMRTDWGLSKRSLMIVYTGLFLPCIAYGASVWGGCLRHQTNRQKLASLQRVAIYACIGVCRTVSTEAMQVLLGVPPLDLVVKKLATLTRVRKGWNMNAECYLNDDEVTGANGLKKCKEMIDEKVLNEWQARWDECDKGRVTFKFIKDVSFSMYCKGFKPSMNLLFILTGHGSLNEFLHKRGLSETSACDCGAPFENWEHVLLECVLYLEYRNLDSMGVVLTRNDDDEWVVDVSRVLETKDRFDAISEYVLKVFADRKMRGRRLLAQNV